MNDIEKRVKRVIGACLSIDPSGITNDLELYGDLGTDSLDMIEIGFLLEEEFDISLRDEDIKAIKTVGQIKQFLEDRLG